MTKKNPVEQSDYIRNEYKKYLKASFSFNDEKLNKKLGTQIDTEPLFKGAYIDINMPFVSTKSLSELINEGTVCKSFNELGHIDLNQKLYHHQELAIRKIVEGRNIVVTTGTGSGKTECFLFPIINEIMKDIEKGDNPPGIRAIMLYPMNALVNDQMGRIRDILSDYPQIRFGAFTGDSPEGVSKKERENSLELKGYSIPDNELVSREEIRDNPPHILFTNYSMLEYLLIRPKDSILFDSDNLGHWKYIVLDEAHTYSGAKGIEVSLLLRRLTGLAHGNKPGFILTSATLGKRGDSEDDIIRFAKKLTSEDFEVSDILFADRQRMDESILEYNVEPGDYPRIEKACADKNTLMPMIAKYTTVDSEWDVNRCLYEGLIKDKHVYQLYSILKDGPKLFKNVLSVFEDMDKEQLVSLIHLINMSRKNNKGLYDLKYHSFVRSLSGAYMTLGNPKMLSIKKCNYIDGLKTFEIGNCRYCKELFIIGKIVLDPDGNVMRLYQNDDVDIYENYDDVDRFNVEYFLLKENVDDREFEENDVTEYTICCKCGAIFITNNLNAHKCDCGSEYAVELLKVNRTKETEAKNNISTCPCCKHTSKSGIVRSLSIGKDEATAIVAQTLYQSMEDNDSTVRKPHKLSFASNNTETDELKSSTKQVLTFSDSRQQASFFAVFFNANHSRFLQKRVIWDAVENANYGDITVDHLITLLDKKIRENQLFPDNTNSLKHAWIAVLSELMLADGAYGAEGLGLFHFALSIDDVMEQLTEEDIDAYFGKYDLNKRDLETLINVLFTTFKTSSAINTVDSTLTLEDKKEFLEYRRFDNYIARHLSKAEKNTSSYLPIKASMPNNGMDYVTKVCKCSQDEAAEVMGMIFDTIGKEGLVFTKHDTKETYQIKTDRYILKNYKTTQYYRCSTCGNITPYNIHGVCTRKGCAGTLLPVDPDEVLRTNYYREQYKTQIIEGIAIAEHTAQLDKETARKYQMDFKNKKINVLSCSTTFEMGVDIGDLETVYMRNVPPTPANYVQRAGRAGRRLDSSAFVLTYCGSTSHDYTFFENPKAMIAGIINPPYFDIENEKIIVRHLIAASLGYFFRIYPEYYENIQQLLCNGGIEELKDYLSSKPQQLGEYIDDEILLGDIHQKYCHFKWIRAVEELHIMDVFVESLRNDFSEFRKAEESAKQMDDYDTAGYYSRQISKLGESRVIDKLSDFSVIPKYGFPVDLVDLKIIKNGRVDNRYDLSRDLRIAISEYAPGSEIIVDGEKYTSRYITTPKKVEPTKYYYKTCDNCGRITVGTTFRSIDTCSNCGRPFDDVNNNDYFIIPEWGFKTGKTVESTRIKPRKSYSGEVAYLGGGESDGIKIAVGHAITVESTTNDKLLVMNRKTFYLCPACGYGHVDYKNTLLPKIKLKHKTYSEFDCECNELVKTHIGHMFKTDVARMVIPSLSLESKNSRAIALSFMYAFLEGLSNAFNIDRNDINGLLDMNMSKDSYDVIIYDDVPGGAGYIKQLMNEDAIKKVLREAKNKVSQNCCDEDTSCYHCLRNYYNQSVHPMLKRKHALQALQNIQDNL